MPCRTDYPDDPPTKGDPYADYRLVKAEFDRFTAMICDQFGNWEGYGELPDRMLLPAVREWWRKHKEADQRRKEREAEVAAQARQARIARLVEKAAELGLTITGVGCGT